MSKEVNNHFLPYNEKYRTSNPLSFPNRQVGSVFLKIDIPTYGLLQASKNENAWILERPGYKQFA